jgi:hypothetical protein
MGTAHSAIGRGKKLPIMIRSNKGDMGCARFGKSEERQQEGGAGKGSVRREGVRARSRGMVLTQGLWPRKPKSATVGWRGGMSSLTRGRVHLDKAT